MPTVIKKLDANSYQLKDQVVAINRVTKVVKGGKNLSFAALVVVGDPSRCGGGITAAGKAKEVPQAIRKAIESAKKNLIKVNLTQTSIPHLVLGRLWRGQGVAEAGSRRHGRNCRRRGARRDDRGGRAERADQIDWHHQPAQCDQGDFRCAQAALKSRESVAAMRGKTLQEIVGCRSPYRCRRILKDQ
jgi:small subunit ribosomal protein S5